MANSNLIKVPFHSDELFVVSANDEPYTPMRPIVVGMGLDWASQYTKLKRNERWGVVIITTPTNDAASEQEMVCMPLRKLFGWLQSIHPNKVKAEIRDKVVQYQNECDDVLWDYWTKGQATNTRTKPKQRALPNGLTADQQETIKSLIKTRVAELPHEKQAKAAITCWSALKSKFGCTYKDIEPDKFTDAVSLVARVPLEGEYIPKRETRPKPMSPKQSRELKEAVHVAFGGWGFSRHDSDIFYNRVRAENNISRFDDLPEHRVEPVKAMIQQIREMNHEFLCVLAELKKHYLQECVGAGAPWTPDLKRKWRKKFEEALPERPNWLEVKQKLMH